MSAILLVAIGATVVALLGLLGRVARESDFTFWQAGTLTVPVLAVCAAPMLSDGYTISSALIATAAIIVGVLIATALGPVRDHPFEGRAVRAGFAWVGAATVALVLAGLTIAWLSTMIAAFSHLNQGYVAVVLTAAAVAMAYGRGAFRGSGVMVTLVVIIGATLIFLGGVFAGSTASLTDPVIEVGDTSPAAIVVYAIAIALVGGTNLGLRSVSPNRKSLLVGGLVVALAGLVGMGGLLMIVGGAIQVPSVPLETLVAYIPAPVAAVIAAIFGMVASIVAGQVMSGVIRTAAPLSPMLVPTRSARLARMVAVIVLGIVIAVIAVWRPSPDWLVPLLAVMGAIGVIIEIAGSREAPVGESAGSDELAVP